MVVHCWEMIIGIDPGGKLRVVSVERVLMLHFVGDGVRLSHLFLATLVGVGAGIAQLALSWVVDGLPLP